MYALLRRSVLAHLCLLLFVLATLPAAHAQILEAGDIAIIGFNYDNPDELAFVALVDIPSGTEIKFTDNGWKADGTFRANEGTFTWTAPSDISAGTVIQPTVSGVFFASAGDQILAYQGEDSSPTFIYALNSEGTGWQTDATNSNTSALPTGLTEGTTAIAHNEVDNGFYSGTTSGTRSELLTAISNPANWTTSNSRVTMPSTDFTVGGGGPGGLVAGDIAIIGFNYDNPDELAFVALVDLPSGTEIKFTDNGWKADGTFRANEGTFTWTAPSDISAGKVIQPTVSGVFFASAGDQILAYQGDDSSPTFIYALNSEGTGWQTDATSSNTSALPTGLTEGMTAIAHNEVDNGFYSGTTSGTRSELLTAISNTANWTTSNSRVTMPSTDFTVGGGGPGGLVAGDIAIIGFNYDNPDELAFVALVDLPSGTEIKFTDNGWKDDDTFRTGEGTFTWTAASDISAGTVIQPTVSGVAFSSSGDQILAYQGEDSSPTFIYALNSEGTGWQSNATNSNTSALPTGLTEGMTAIAHNEVDNGFYSGTTSGTRSELLTAISNTANWTTDNSRVTMPSTDFTVGGGGSASDGDGTATLANAAGPLSGTDIFRRGDAGQSLAVTITGVDTGALESASVAIPADWSAPMLSNVVLSGAGFSSASASVSGQTITITGAALTDTDTGTVTVSNLMPRTPTSTTDDGRDEVTVETASGSGTLTAIAESPTAFVTIPLSSLRDTNAAGVPADDGETVAVEGVATAGSGIFDPNNLSVFIQDATAGMNLYSASLDPVVPEGNAFVVKGSVIQFNGLTEVSPAALSDIVDLGASTPVTPTSLTIAQILATPEDLEGTLATITGVTIVSGTWPPEGSSANLTITDDGGTSQLTLRIDNDTNIDGTTEPSGTFDLTGLIGQFDNSSPFTDGYQILPRYTSDISTLDVPVFQFARVYSVHQEADGSSSVAITVTNPDDTNPMDVTISATGGTGDAGTDLSGFSSQTFTFLAGSTTPQTVNFMIVNDGDNSEAVEYLTFGLSSSDGMIGSRGTFTLWLMDGPVPTKTLFPGLTGTTLLNAIRDTYGNPMTLGYDIARDTMYGVIDYDAVGRQVCGIYGGYCAPLNFPGEDPSSTVFQGGDGISAEHSFPQSMGAGDEPQRSNLHNLFGVKQTINSARSNHPYAEIDDSDTDTWYINDTSQNTIPGSNLESYSELDSNSPAEFEPRHDAKGKVSRAMFYFYAIYESVANDAFFNGQTDDLNMWHQDHPVTAEEALRNVMIAAYQGNKLNPFIIDPTLVNRAFGLDQVSCTDTNTAPFWDGTISPQGNGVAFIPLQAQAGLGTVVLGDPTTNLALREIRSADGSTVLPFTGSTPVPGDGAGAGCDDGFETLTFSGPSDSEPTDVLLVVCAPQENQGSNFYIEVSDTCSPTPRTLRVDPILELFSTSTETVAGLPTEFQLDGNYPNPFNPETVIGYALPEAANVRVVVYDVLGRQVRVLADGWQQAGRFEVRWDGQDGRGALMPSGTYLYRLEAGPFQQTRRMTLVK